MGLTKFKLVHHDGIKSVNFEDRDYPLDQLTDAQAEKLYGFTHVLEKVPTPTTAVATADAVEAKAKAK